MPLPEKDNFLKEVLSHIKFPFDRDNVKAELEDHISEKTECYVEQGYDKTAAEQQSVNDMGDAKEIGIELNKQHKPLLGWLWIITNVLVAIFLATTIFFIVIPVVFTAFDKNQIKIPKSDIVYKIDLNEKVNLGGKTIHFTSVIYEKNGDMNIYYKYYDTDFSFATWNLGTIGEITDNLGNKYLYGGYDSGGIIHKASCNIRNFSKEANLLIIKYDSYNRKYKVEIPLKSGDKYE